MLLISSHKGYSSLFDNGTVASTKIVIVFNKMLDIIKNHS